MVNNGEGSRREHENYTVIMLGPGAEVTLGHAKAEGGSEPSSCGSKEDACRKRLFRARRHTQIEVGRGAIRQRTSECTGPEVRAEPQEVKRGKKVLEGTRTQRGPRGPGGQGPRSLSSLYLEGMGKQGRGRVSSQGVT